MLLGDERAKVVVWYDEVPPVSREAALAWDTGRLTGDFREGWLGGCGRKTCGDVVFGETEDHRNYAFDDEFCSFVTSAR